ncbi:hypothetical protein GRZ55_23130, partial [Chelativorans sp. ZYF759]|nr:hypothetical protein [Chelativorans sp. ZYF759]
MNEATVKSPFRNNVYNMNPVYQKSNTNSVSSFKLNTGISKYASGKEVNNNNSSNTNIINNSNISSSNNINNSSNAAGDKRFKTLPSTEMLPRNEVLGGYIFV